MKRADNDRQRSHERGKGELGPRDMSCGRARADLQAGQQEHTAFEEEDEEVPEEMPCRRVRLGMSSGPFQLMYRPQHYGRQDAGAAELRRGQ